MNQPKISLESQLTTHKVLLRDLYTGTSQNLTLDEVVAHMIEHHQLSAPNSTYVRLFKAWGFRKNKRGLDYVYIDRTIKRRKAEEGKESQVFDNGKLIPLEKINKEISRNVTISQQLSYARTRTPPLPIGITVSTPPDFNTFDDLSANMLQSNPDTNHGYLDSPYIESSTLLLDFIYALKDKYAKFSMMINYEKTTLINLLTIFHNCVEVDELPGSTLLQYASRAAKLLLYAARQSPIPMFAMELLDHQIILDMFICALNGESPASYLEKPVVEERFMHASKVAIFIVATFGNVNTAASLLSAGIYADPTNKDGITPLLVAAELNHPKIVDLLLSKGAQLNRTYENGETVWSKISFRPSHDEVAQVLLYHGANPKFHTDGNHKFLDGVFRRGDVESLVTDLRHGMNPSKKSTTGIPLILQAINHCQLEMVTVLVEAGADTSCIILSDFPTSLEVLKSYGTQHHSSLEAKLRIYEYLAGCGVFSAQEPTLSDVAGPETTIASTEDLNQYFKSLSLSSSKPEYLFVGSGPPRDSYVEKHLGMVASPASSQISFSIGSLFGNEKSLPLAQLPSPASFNRLTRLPIPRSLEMPHPRW